MCSPFFFSDNAEKLQVILGRTFRKENSSGEQIFGVEKFWIHEKFDNETYDNDIGEWRFQEKTDQSFFWIISLRCHILW